VALKMEVTDKGLIFGTPHYMSPEQGHGKPIDARSDLYALGVMLYEMLTGKKPFDADNHMAILVHHAKAPIPRLPERIAVLQPIIDTLMAKEPGDRPASAADAAKMINDTMKAMPPPSATATVPMPVLTTSHASIPAAPLTAAPATAATPASTTTEPEPAAQPTPTS
jgi:serine/threonine protein kinase